MLQDSQQESGSNSMVGGIHISACDVPGSKMNHLNYAIATALLLLMLQPVMVNAM
jgi:hypothetical protein